MVISYHSWRLWMKIEAQMKFSKGSAEVVWKANWDSISCEMSRRKLVKTFMWRKGEMRLKLRQANDVLNGHVWPTKFLLNFMVAMKHLSPFEIVTIATAESIKFTAQNAAFRSVHVISLRFELCCIWFMVHHWLRWKQWTTAEHVDNKSLHVLYDPTPLTAAFYCRLMNTQ